MKPLFILILLFSIRSAIGQDPEYFPLPDSQDGWRMILESDSIHQQTGINLKKLDEAFEFVKTTSPNGGLLVLRHGTLVYEKYFGKGQREATPNLGSIGKPFTSIAVGILMEQYPSLFPDGLDQKIFNQDYFPEKIFPLPDARMAEIKLGQLLSFTAGIRGNNPVYVDNLPASIDPVGPDGWQGMTDRFVFGMKEGTTNGVPFTTRTLWCDPGEGYSYATASIHMASAMVRHISGMELKDYLTQYLANPMGWGRWGFAYQNQPIENTPGGGGIALRSTDMLRFGYLLLNNGKWGNQQLVPKSYVQAATTASPYNPHYPYSLQFNVNTNGELSNLPKDAFWKVGSGWHCLFVVPSLDLVVWKLGGRNGQYSASNTGFTELDPLPDAEKAITGQPSYEGDIYSRTLELVIESIVDRPDQPLPGQIIRDPIFPNKLVYNKDDDQDGNQDPFFLSGSGDPEGFLYRGSRNQDGTRDGDQLELINKLADYGGNGLYFIAVRTHGGDAWKSKRDEPDIYPDDQHNPWLDGEPKGGLNIKILDQWEEWFDEMEKNNIILYFYIYDDAIKIADQFGWPLDENGELHPGEKAFIQELVNRFEHHKNLIWVVMEEGQEIGSQWQQHISKIAEAIQEADNYDHLIGAHQLGGNIFFHKNDPVISQFAIQTHRDEVNTIDELHQWLVKGWQDSENLYSLVMSEDYYHGNRSVPNQDREEIRKRNWAAAMANCYVMVFGFDIATTPHLWLKDLRTMQQFFESTTYNQMIPSDSLAADPNVYVLSNGGYDYIIYANQAGKTLAIKNINKGSYSLRWLDCITGEVQNLKDMEIEEGFHTWTKPTGFGPETALYVYRTDERPILHKLSSVRKVVSEYKGPNKVPVVQDYSIHTGKNQPVEIQLRYTDPDGGPGPYTIELLSTPKHGKLSGVDNDRVYTPKKNYQGSDQFSWKVNDGVGTSDISRITIFIK